MYKNTVSVDGAHIILQSEYKHVDRCRSIEGGRWDPQCKAWIYPLSLFTARRIEEAFTGVAMTWDEHFKKLVMDVKRQAWAQQCAAQAKDGQDLAQPEITKRPSWKHQLQAYHFARNLPGAMLAMGMGVGKSKITVDIVVNQGYRRTLILCPKSVVSVWPKEFEKDAGLAVAVSDPTGSTADKLCQAKSALQIAEMVSRPVVVVINYEAAWREPLASWLIKAGFDCLVLDESHRIKAPSGVASLFCKRLGQAIPHRLALTGTPMPHSPLDIYAQYRVIAPEIFGTSFTRFRARYAIMGGFGNHQVTAYQNQDEINKKFYSIAFRVDRDVLDLPEAVHVERRCELSNRARRVYKDLEKEYVAEIDAGTITAANALSKLLRLQQITSGYARTEQGDDVHLDTAKADLLEDIVEDLATDEPVVVFCRFHHDLDAVRAVAAKLGRRVGELSGRASDLAAWQAGDYDILAVQIQSGGVGIDLTRARYAVYFSLGFSLGDYEQSLARIHRPGQTRPCTYIHLIASDTVDEKVYSALAERKQVVEYVLDTLRPR